MAKIGPPVETPDFGRDFRAEIDWLEDFLKNHTTVKFPVADGYAHYLVEDDYTLRHIDALDGYYAHPALIRGLTKAEIDAQLDYQDRLRELFT